MSFRPAKLGTSAEFEVIDYIQSEILKLLPYITFSKLKRELKLLNYDFPNLGFKKFIRQLYQHEPEILYAILTNNFLTLEKFVEFLRDGVIVTITGTRGSGKTDFAYLITEQLPDYLLVTNNHINNYNYVFCNSNRKLIEIFKREKEKPKIVVLDEAQEIFSAYSSVFSPHVKIFLKEQTYARKNKSIFIYICPELGTLSLPLRQASSFVVQKKEKTKALVYGKENPIPVVIRQIPKTRIEFNTLEKATWKKEKIKSKRDDYLNSDLGDFMND